MKNVAIITRLKKIEGMVGVNADLTGHVEDYGDDVLETFIVRETGLPLEEALLVLTGGHRKQESKVII